MGTNRRTFSQSVAKAIAIFIFFQSPIAYAETVEVLLRHAHYRPEQIQVAPGDTVIFRNTDDYEHSIKLVDQPGILSPVEILGAGSHSFTVPESMAGGTFLLGCDEHPNMFAELVVSAP